MGGDLGDRVVMNGRVLVKPGAGVRRYAEELQARLGLPILAPPERWSAGSRGHAWEQTVLPLRAGSRLLWCPANTGPLGRRRQVITIHDASVLDHPEWFQPGFARWYAAALPRLARRAVRVLTDSRFSRARLLEHTGVPDDRIAAIPLGVDARFAPGPGLTPEERAEQGLPERFVLAVSSVEPRKNATRLVQAWERVAARVPDVGLVWAGGSDPRVFRAGLGPNGDAAGRRVRWLGFVPDESLPALYRSADLFVFPSLYEGFGLPVLEAMACGCPVAASEIPPLREIGADALATFDPRSPEALAEVLERLLLDGGARAKLASAGRERAAGFRWETCAQATARILDESA